MPGPKRREPKGCQWRFSKPLWTLKPNTLAEYNMFDYMPNWIQPLVGAAAGRAAKLRDPNLRAAMKQDMVNPLRRTNWEMMKVAQATQERNLV